MKVKEPVLREEVKFDKHRIGKENIDLIIKDLRYIHAYVQSIANREYVFSTGLFNTNYDLDIATDVQLIEINFLTGKIHDEMVEIDRAIRKAQDNR